jgi:hypothetical protein
MALTRASNIAAAACRRAVAGVRTVRRAVVRRSDVWLYGLDQEYPEYDAYRRRPRRIAWAVGMTARAAKRARTRLPNSRGSDVSDPPGLVGELPPVDVENAPAVPPAASGVGSRSTTPDTRHTSAIPSTFAPGAA